MLSKKQKTEAFLETQTTLTNDKLVLGGVCALLLGIVIGFTFAPIKKGIKVNVFSNNFRGCKKSFGYTNGNSIEGNSASSEKKNLKK